MGIMMNNKRVYVILLLLIVTMMSLSACGGSSGKGLDELLDYYEENGFTIGDKQEKMVEMIGAEDGFGIHLNDSHVEFYIYEKGSKDLAYINKNGEYDLEILVVSAIANGNLVLMGYEDVPDESKIVKLFNDF